MSIAENVNLDTSTTFSDSTALPAWLRFFIFMLRYVLPIGIAVLLFGLLGTLLVASRFGALGSPTFYLILIVFGVIMAFVSAGARAARRLHEREPRALRSMKGWLLFAIALTVATMADGLFWPSEDSEVPRIVDFVYLSWSAGWFVTLNVSKHVKQLFTEAGNRHSVER
jgi:hypothetical protein